MITLQNDHGTATIHPFGGQVMSYVPRGGAEVLWRTTDSIVDATRASGKAPRGGVPVCWPWFGPHPDNKAAPVHGLARIADWRVGQSTAGQATLELAVDGSNPDFPHAARAVLGITLGDALLVALTTTNTGSTPFSLTQGLHTYFRVGDVGEVEVLGLEGAVSQKGDRSTEPVRIDGEVDRIYAPVTGLLRIVDRSIGRVINVQNGGCTEAVVWNPGADKPDMPAGGYRNMLCVEPANARDAPTLRPGESHTISTRVWASPLA